MSTPVLPTSFIADTPTRVLYDAVDATPFAYARRGHDFYRLKDHVLWAQENAGALRSARSGARFAYRVGRIFYDAVTKLPLYYERDGDPSVSRHASRRADLSTQTPRGVLP